MNGKKKKIVNCILSVKSIRTNQSEANHSFFFFSFFFILFVSISSAMTTHTMLETRANCGELIGMLLFLLATDGAFI